jgi:hypothetical protein
MRAYAMRVRREASDRGVRHRWRSLSPARRYALVRALPYAAGAVLAYLFVVLGSAKPQSHKIFLIALPLAFPLLVAVLWGVTKVWPRRWRLLVWVFGLAVVVPCGWWWGRGVANRSASGLGSGIGWSLAVLWLFRSGLLPSPDDVAKVPSSD